MVYLHGLGHFHPENEITNTFLESLDIGTTEEWILERVGIHSRRTVLDLEYIRETRNLDPRMAPEASEYTNAETGAAAARLAMARAGVKPEDIGMVISGSSAPEHLSPAEAATIANALGIEALCIDINSACTTFGMHLMFLDKMRPESMPRFILLVYPENLTRSMDYADRRTAVLFGDGTAAAVVSLTEPSRMIFKDSAGDSNPSGWDKVVIPRWGFFNQEGNAVQGFAIRRMTTALRELQAAIAGNGFRPDRLLFVGHQANYGMLQMVCERAGIVEENHWHNVIDFGNTGCAGAPTVLSQRWDSLRAGDCVALTVVGSGLSWAHTRLIVGDE